MGVDINCSLTTHTSVKDLGTALALAMGFPLVKHPVGGVYWYAEASGHWSIKSSPAVETCYDFIAYGVSMSPHGTVSLLVHSESASPSGYVRCIIPRSTPFWLAVAEKLVQCFGGSLVAKDSDGIVVLEVPPVVCMSAEDGGPWMERQDRLAAVTAVTKEDIDRWAPFAAYGVAR